jgi:hypothetical protein
MKIENIETQVIRELEERLLQPRVRHSEKEVSELLSDDFIEYRSSIEDLLGKSLAPGFKEYQRDINLFMHTFFMNPGLKPLL